MKRIFLNTALILIFAATVPVMAQSQYQITRTLNLPGDGFWDYLTVDETHNRVFASHSSHVQVVDLKTGTLTGTIENTKGVHGIALAPSLNKGFTSNGQDSSVTAFNLATLQPLGKIKVHGSNPDAILYDEFSKKVFTGNGRSASFSVIDAENDREVAVIPLEGKPEAIVTNGKGKIYVNIEDKNLIEMIDAVTLKVVARWSIEPGDEPSGLALDNQNHLLFSVCGNKLMVVTDAETGKQVATLPIGDGCDGAAFDPDSKRVYSSNGEGTMTVVQVVSAKTFKVLENFPTLQGARTIALDMTTHRIYMPTAEFGAPPADGSRRPSLKPGSFRILEISVVK